MLHYRLLFALLIAVLFLPACNEPPAGRSTPVAAPVALRDPPLAAHYATLGAGHPVSEMGWHMHDPSRVVTLDGYRMVAVTGKEPADGYDCGLELWYLPPDAGAWEPGQCILREPAPWVAEQVPTNDGAYWAPTFGDARTLYYTVPTPFDDDSGQSCIGMATASGTPPRLHWTDSGAPLLCYGLADAPGPTAALDPAYFEDSDGTPYLVFGGGDAWLVELDPATGRVVDDAVWSPDTAQYHLLAREPGLDNPNNPDALEWMEAASIHEHDGMYYLFVNWGACCRGLDSTYEIRVGRADTVTGPYRDRAGRDLRDGGGTLFLDRYGDALDDPRYYAPGHAGVAAPAAGGAVVTFHYYDATNDGIPWLGMAELTYADGWVQPGDALPVLRAE